MTLSEWVFPAADGKCHRPHYCKKVLQRVCKELGLGQVLDEVLDIEAAPSIRRRKVQSLVRRWMKTREIPQKFKEPVKEMMNQLGVVPSIIRAGAIDEEWFEPPEQGMGFLQLS